MVVSIRVEMHCVSSLEVTAVRGTVACTIVVKIVKKVTVELSQLHVRTVSSGCKTKIFFSVDQYKTTLREQAMLKLASLTL